MTERGKKARDEPPPTLELTRRGLIDLLVEADVTYPARATKTVLLDLLTLHREGPYLQFSQASTRAGAIRTLESLAQIEAGAEGGALQERTTTTRTAKDGTTTTTVRERLSSSFSLTRSLNRTSTKGSPSSASRRAPRWRAGF